MSELKPSPGELVPITPMAFEILLALGDSEKHGYAIMREIQQRTGAESIPHPGTLYRAIARMVDSQLLEELDDRPAPEFDDGRRRAYYRITRQGREIARAEAQRLDRQVDTARSKRFLPDTTPA